MLMRAPLRLTWITGGANLLAVRSSLASASVRGMVSAKQQLDPRAAAVLKFW
jgi:hypothetical protein